jgi:hypothetical protein
MNSLRWLMKHPILLAWVLAVVAILLNFGMGGGVNGKHTLAAVGGHGQQVAGESATEAGAASAGNAAEDAAAGNATGAAAPAGTATAETDLLRAAREAYWSNEFDNSIGFYTSLLKQVPDSIQYKGELANVYWKQGDSANASRLYTDIAPLLAAQGRSTEALNMKLYVDAVNPELAKTIDAALSK